MNEGQKQTSYAEGSLALFLTHSKTPTEYGGQILSLFLMCRDVDYRPQMRPTMTTATACRETL